MGSFWPVYKHAIISSIWEEKSLDFTFIHSYCPLKQNSLKELLLPELSTCLFPFPPKRTSIRLLLHHSTETALVKVTGKLYIATANGQFSVLFLVILPTACDTDPPFSIAHQDTRLSWFFYLTDFSFSAFLAGSPSSPRLLNVEMCKGSVSDPLPFSI